MTLSHRDGSKYDGVLHTFGLEDSGPGVELVVVTPRGALGAKAAKPEKRMLFHPADVVRIDCKYSLQDDLLGARAQGARRPASAPPARAAPRPRAPA